MNVLGIETSCDDTSASVIENDTILSNIVSSQLIHNRFGGVVPELASRAHIQQSIPVIKEALAEADMKKDDIDGISVTFGPGLVGSLLVGLSIAKGLSLSLNIPFIGVNHLEGHIWANFIDHPHLSPPFIVLIVSGGHTQIVYVKDYGVYEVLGRTRDDAAGEAFDKVAKILNLGYPGGPAIEKTAEKGDPAYFRFPRAYLDKDSFDFSFSGLKTSVMNHVYNIGKEEAGKHIEDIAVCFQEAVIDVLVKKTIMAAKRLQAEQICIAGGVAQNKSLRKCFKKSLEKSNIDILWPSPLLCTDNGAMIAATGLYYLKKGKSSPHSLSPNSSLNL